MVNGQTDIARVFVDETAQQIATRHAIAPRTVRGWLSQGMHPEVAECFASMSDLGHSPDMLNAAVYALTEGRPIGDLPDITEG